MNGEVLGFENRVRDTFISGRSKTWSEVDSMKRGKTSKEIEWEESYVSNDEGKVCAVGGKVGN